MPGLKSFLSRNLRTYSTVGPLRRRILVCYDKAGIFPCSKPPRMEHGDVSSTTTTKQKINIPFCVAPFAALHNIHICLCNKRLTAPCLEIYSERKKLRPLLSRPLHRRPSTLLKMPSSNCGQHWKHRRKGECLFSLFKKWIFVFLSFVVIRKIVFMSHQENCFILALIWIIQFIQQFTITFCY